MLKIVLCLLVGGNCAKRSLFGVSVVVSVLASNVERQLELAAYFGCGRQAFAAFPYFFPPFLFCQIKMTRRSSDK